jgi:hypothetical protein
MHASGKSMTEYNSYDTHFQHQNYELCSSILVGTQSATHLLKMPLIMMNNGV